MPDLAISQLNPLTTLLTGDVGPFVDGGSTQKADVDTLANSLNINYFKSQDPHFKIIASNFTIQQTGFVNIIVGGDKASNIVAATDSSILAGATNQVTANYAAIGAGVGGFNHAVYSFIGGGVNCLIDFGALQEPQASVIGGGTINQIYFGQNSFIGAGNRNYTSGNNNVIVGGNSNSGNSLSTAIVGGEKNWIQRNADFGFIGGGSGNILGSLTQYSCIGGGETNLVTSSNHAVIAGGAFNHIINVSNAGFIGAGVANSFGASPCSSIVGGTGNNLGNSTNSFIGGGFVNSINPSDNSVIAGGANNTITFSNFSFTAGQSNTISNANNSSILGSFSTILPFHVGSMILSDNTSVLGTKQSHAVNSLALCFAGGVVISGGRLLLDSGVAVANNAADPGQIGEVFISGIFLYCCTGINPGNSKTWGRLQLTEW